MATPAPPPRLSCRNCPTRQRAEWKVLSDEAQALVDARKQPRTYAPGAPVFQPGDPTAGLFCIHRGTVGLRRTDEQGNSALVKLAHEGETFGVYEYFHEADYVAGAEALSDAVICFVERPVVQELLLAHAPLGLAFMAHLAQDLEHAHGTVLQIAALPVRRRLAHLLLQLEPHYGHRAADGATVIELPMTQHTVAELLGARRETVVRAFQALQAEGLLNYEEGRVTVADLARLRAEVEEG